MPGLDTNVLARWLVDDDPLQTAAVGRVFRAAIADGRPLFVPTTVMLELEWVLRSRYRFDKDTVLGTFNTMLETQELQFQDEASLEQAIHRYRETKADFADCLHAGACASVGRIPLLTFDEKAARLPDVELLIS